MNANLKQLKDDLLNLERVVLTGAMLTDDLHRQASELVLNMKGTLVLLSNEGELERRFECLQGQPGDICSHEFCRPKITAPPFLAPGDSLRDNALTLVIAEMDRQDRKWGSQRKQPSGTWLKILIEECGEMAGAMLYEDNGQPPPKPGHTVENETTQIAAVAIQHLMARLQSKLDAIKLRL